MRTTIDRTGSAVVTLPSDTAIQIVRKFDAPADLVFDVWTQAEHVRNWWGFPEHEMTVCEVDLRVGGEYRYVSLVPDFGEVAFRGVFTHIERPSRLESTEIYEAYPDTEAKNVLILEESGGVTTMTVTATYPSRATRDAVVASGMETGLQVSLDRVDAILTHLTGDGR